MEIGKRQNTSNLLMVRPAFFRYNTQTDDNIFATDRDNIPYSQLIGKEKVEIEEQMSQIIEDLKQSPANVFDLKSPTVLSELKHLYLTQEVHKKALNEFDKVVEQLRTLGVNVFVVEDEPLIAPPDSVFSNNWITTHQDGTVIVYPMRAESRRKEVRLDVIANLNNEHGFYVKQLIDWTPKADERHFLEGTGSMVFDRVNNTAYAALSDRTHPELLVFMLSEINCRLIAFETDEFANPEGIPFPVYHTDVMMCIGEHYAVVCTDVIKNERQREKVISELTISGHEVISISKEQLIAFAGNMLEVENSKGEKILCMSTTAYESLTMKQIRQMKAHAHLEAFDVPVIETVGGGSIRCMLTEIFLPTKEDRNREVEQVG